MTSTTMRCRVEDLYLEVIGITYTPKDHALVKKDSSK